MRRYPSDMPQLTMGGGKIAVDEAGETRLWIPAKASGYANAQLDDHRALPRAAFPWRPPVTMRLRAKASLGSPLGTLGFGFWNDPFSLTFGQAGAARKLPVPPRAVWFFYGSPPNDMALAPPNPGWGWKAQCMTAPAIPGWMLALPAATAYVAAKVPFLRGPIMRLSLARLTCAETQLETGLDTWHTYEIRWEVDRAAFLIDGKTCLESTFAPSGPLGFVTWIDNQFAVASPSGGLRFGVLPTDTDQSLSRRDLVLAKDDG
jgi:hypothetical protein